MPLPAHLGLPASRAPAPGPLPGLSLWRPLVAECGKAWDTWFIQDEHLWPRPRVPTRPMADLAGLWEGPGGLAGTRPLTTTPFAVILEKPIRIPRFLSVKASHVLKGFLNKVRSRAPSPSVTPGLWGPGPAVLEPETLTTPTEQRGAYPRGRARRLGFAAGQERVPDAALPGTDGSSFEL